ncbi:MAG: TIGR02530 family flagellar biosynthesis protein [Anaerolineae bacterium]
MANPVVDGPSLRPAGTTPASGTYSVRRPAVSAAQTSFEETLQSVQSDSALKISKHAQTRLAERGLTLSSDEMQRLEGAVDKAAAKGSRDSLVLMDDLALVVSIRNRTVITAVDANSRKGNVFTNIDSVVLAE